MLMCLELIEWMYNRTWQVSTLIAGSVFENTMLAPPTELEKWNSDKTRVDPIFCPWLTKYGGKSRFSLSNSVAPPLQKVNDTSLLKVYSNWVLECNRNLNHHTCNYFCTWVHVCTRDVHFILPLHIFYLHLQIYPPLQLIWSFLH